MTRILLIQIRERVDVEKQERDCFIELCGIKPAQLQSVNLVRDPSPPWSLIDEADVVMIGGAGVYSATNDYEFTAPLIEHIIRMCNEDKPLLGSCFGHQMIARALGGEVVTDGIRAEVGTHELRLTPEGLNDPLFEGLPERFSAHMGHKDHVTRLPVGAVELAFTEKSRNQAFRLTGKPIYGTQFHVELNPARLIERLAIYQDIYMPQDDEFEHLKQNPRPTPEAERLISRFVAQCSQP